MIRARQHLKAATLIELLIVTAIIGIAVSVFLTDWSSGRAAQDLAGATTEVEAVFREAQNYALTGFQNNATEEPCRFQVSWGGSDYRIVYWYKNSSGVCTQSSTPLRSYTLKNGVMFSAGSSFYFTLPHAVPSFSGAYQAAVLTKSGVSQAVCTYRNGRISTHTGSTCP